MLRTARTLFSSAFSWAMHAPALGLVLVAAAVIVSPVALPQGADAQQRRVVVVTDSILLGARAPLVDRLQGAGWAVDFDGSVSRSTLAGADAVRGHGPALTDTLVIGLGANDAGNTSTFRSRVDAVMAAAAAVPHVYWLTIRESRPYYVAANQVLREAAARHPNLRIIDWNAASAAGSGLTASDGLHLTPAGAQRLADLVAGTVTSGAAPAVAPAPGGGTAAPPVPVESAPEVASPAPAAAEPAVAAPDVAPEPPSEAVTPGSLLDRSAFVATDDPALGRVQPTGVPTSAGRSGGRSAWWWLAPATVLAAAAYLSTSWLAGRSKLAAALIGTSGPVRRSALSRAELRAARIAGAQDRHPTGFDPPPVPEEPAPVVCPEVTVGLSGSEPSGLSGTGSPPSQNLSL